jgi:Flp pilus assembly protein TadG
MRPPEPRGEGVHRTRCTPSRGRARSTRGAVTAETAMMLPLLVATTLALVWLLALAAAQTRVVDAAREVARAVARDEPRAAALALGRRVAPEGAEFRVRSGEGHVVVDVTAEVRGPGGLFRFAPGVTVDARAVAAAETR